METPEIPTFNSFQEARDFRKSFESHLNKCTGFYVKEEFGSCKLVKVDVNGLSGSLVALAPNLEELRRMVECMGAAIDAKVKKDSLEDGGAPSSGPVVEYIPRV